MSKNIKSWVLIFPLVFLFFLCLLLLQLPAKNIRGTSNHKIHSNLSNIGKNIIEKDSNKAASIKIVKTTFKPEVADFTAPQSWNFLILETEWENIHPKQKMSKDKLEGKTDRTMGVSTFAGGKKKKKTKYVDVDVAYMIEEFFNHAYLIADGLAYPLNKLTAEIPGGADLQNPFIIAKKGEVRKANFVYLIPKNAQNLGFQFFDYKYGHILLSIQGNLAKARGSGGPPSKVLGTIKSDSVEIAAHSFNFQSNYAEEEAPQGWHFTVVRLSGKSLLGKEIKDIVQVEPKKYTWIFTESNYLYYCVGGSTTDEGFIRFTPEIYQYQELAFLVPVSVKVYRLGIRLRNDVFYLDLTKMKPEPRPKAIASHRDGETMEVMVFGMRQEGSQVILDLGIQSLVKSGLEIQMDAQFILNAGGEKLYVDGDATATLAYQPPDPFIIPPGMFVRFEIAYDTDASPSSLYFRGYESENYFKLK